MSQQQESVKAKRNNRLAGSSSSARFPDAKRTQKNSSTAVPAVSSIVNDKNMAKLKTRMVWFPSFKYSSEVVFYVPESVFMKLRLAS